MPTIWRLPALLGACLAVTGCAGRAPTPVSDNPSLPHANTERPAAAIRSNDFESLRLQAERAPTEAWWPYRLGELQAADGSLEDAALSLEAALTREPDHAAALTLLAEVWYRQGQHEVAAPRLIAWLSAHPGAPSAVHAALALHLEALDRLVEAQTELALCDDDDPATARVRTWIGLRGDGFAATLAPARRAAESPLNSAADHNNLGIALLYAGRPAEAREAFIAALADDPSLPGALYNLAIVESVYFFDDRAARHWLSEYRRHASADPDGLFVSLMGEVAAAGDGAASAPVAVAGAEVLP